MSSPAATTTAPTRTSPLTYQELWNTLDRDQLPTVERFYARHFPLGAAATDQYRRIVPQKLYVHLGLSEAGRSPVIKKIFSEQSINKKSINHDDGDGLDCDSRGCCRDHGDH
mmetsp:Transcript_15013/g.36934  ORF Transcript_15013/g.36934 Transcript_15013/m.36934 type:complete len:112 (+) Transcript_15013:224-559(+)